jgi:hypothetical protein
LSAAGMSIAARASLEVTAEIAEGLGDDNRLTRAACVRARTLFTGWVSCEPFRLKVFLPPSDRAVGKGVSLLESEFTVPGVGMCAWLGKHGAYLSTAEGRCNDRDLAG